MLSYPAAFPGLLCDYLHLLPPSGNAEAPPFPQGEFPLNSFPVKCLRNGKYRNVDNIYMVNKKLFTFLPLVEV